MNVQTVLTTTLCIFFFFSGSAAEPVAASVNANSTTPTFSPFPVTAVVTPLAEPSPSLSTFGSFAKIPDLRSSDAFLFRGPSPGDGV